MILLLSLDLSAAALVPIVREIVAPVVVGFLRKFPRLMCSTAISHVDD
jgi:hypothetical protein